MRIIELLEDALDFQTFKGKTSSTEEHNNMYKEWLKLFFGPDAPKKNKIWWIDNKVLYDTTSAESKHNKKILLQLLEKHSLKDVVGIWDSMRIWSTNAYARLNNTLRSGSAVPARVKWIDTYMQDGPKFKGRTVYRGIDGEFLKNIKEGKILKDAGYSAASTHPGIAEYFATRKTKGAVLQITGASNVAVYNFRRAIEEEEILFPRNTKFEIIKITPAVKGKPAYIKARVVK